MNTLEDKIATLQPTSLEDKIAALQPPEEPSVVEEYVTQPISRGIQQFNIGLAHMLGLPQMGEEILRKVTGFKDDTLLPSGREIQQKMADFGMTYTPGTEPDTLSDRIYQNLGAAAIPGGIMTAKGLQVTKALVPEILAAYGGAGGGKIAESTDWGRAHPAEARAVGELVGGLGLSSTSVIKKGITTPVGLAYKLASAPYRGAWAKKRAIKRLSEVVQDPATAAKGVRELEDTGLTASQKAGEREFAGLRRRVEEGDIPERRAGVAQRSQVTQELKDEVRGVERIAAVRSFLDKRFKDLAEEAERTLSGVKGANTPEYYSTMVNKKLRMAYDEAREAENKIWSKLGKGDQIEPTEVIAAYRQEMSGITRGGDIKEVDDFLRKKLGAFTEKGDMIGGEFLSAKNNKATAKELHQFSARIGRQIRALSEQAGNTNKIRILNKVKTAALKDLERTAVGDDYKAAIALSKELNKKFTQGNIGGVLGFNRGLATPETMILDEIIGSGGEKARLAVEQLFSANPKAKADIENFIKSKFALAAENSKIHKIDTQKGRQFLKKNSRVMEAFPKLKTQIEDAISKQRKVDDFMGSTDISDASPLVKDKAAAGIFINADPGDEMARILKYGRAKGQTKKYFSDLVKETKKDKTGSAHRGLKNAFSEELMNTSELSKKMDELTGESFVSGVKFLRQLRRLKSPALKSGLIDKSEYMALEKIGESFKRIELELTAPVPKAIMADAPGQVMDIIARMTGAHIGGMTGAASAGGSLQMAGIGSGLAKKFINFITKDEARSLLVEATKDPKLLNDLLADVSKMTERRQMAMVDRIKTRALELGNRSVKAVTQAQAPAMAVIPPVVSATKEKETLEDKIRRL